MSVLKDDFIGFTYNNKHSSELGILRVSNGSRFDENLLPTMQDKTQQVPGGDGTYYFGSNYTQKQFPISFAFDNLSEQQISEIKRHFGDKKIHDLVFDENPYKIYSAKVTGSATLKHIPFEEKVKNETKRIYKGEGSLQFTCYQPYAVCKKKWLSEYVEENKYEWAVASRLKEEQGNYDKLVDNKIAVYNAGDIDTHFILQLKFINGKIPSGNFFLEKTGEQLKWNEMPVKGEDTYIKFNSKLNLIEGYNSSNIKTGNIYNEYILAGSFFKIPVGEETIVIDTNAVSAVHEVPIEYNYYYL